MVDLLVETGDRHGEEAFDQRLAGQPLVVPDDVVGLAQPELSAGGCCQKGSARGTWLELAQGAG